MKPALYTRVMLNRDIAEQKLQRSDIATLVDYIDHPSGGEEGAILEIFNLVGESIGVVAVPVSAIEPLRAEYVPTARALIF